MPDGKHILFHVLYAGAEKANAIAIGDLKTGEHRILFDGTIPRYSASGHILYLAANGALMAMPFDGKGKVTGGAFPVIPSPGTGPEVNWIGTFGGIETAVSQIGTLMYAPRSFQTSELTWVTRDGRAQAVDSTWHGAFSFFSLSPDGKRLAVAIADRSGTNVWVKELDHGPAHKLTFEGRVSNYAAWTPDGQSVSYYTDAHDPHLHLWMKRADASAQAVSIPTKGNPVESEWSHDGKWLIFRTSVQISGKGDIFAIRLGSDTVAIPLAVTKYGEQDPVISPNDRWLAYSSNETGRYEIYVVPFPNASSAKWPISNEGGSEPVWSRNGRELFYRDGQGRMVAVEVTANAPTFSAGGSKVLFSARDYVSGASHRQYDVAADGRFMMLRQNYRGVQDSIIVVENWFDELKSKSNK
ncbi:MAG: PD40 domain-containing protein [Gemmatimonadaceae bacterium]|nr:PD40 domain-containing protein [Gemmatimonadaceae bacterium]